MERRDLRPWLYLSGIDASAADLARKHGLGFEISDFCWAPRQEEAAAWELMPVNL